MSRARVIWRLASACAVLACAAPLAAEPRFDPALRFRVLATPHFLVYFHDGEARLASRLAAIAEDTRVALAPTLGIPAQARVHVVLVDQSDLANGWASTVPYDTIVVSAAAPSGAEFVGLTDDWLRLVFTHEYAHIVHLDRSRGWARAVRAVFGRTPLAFPNLFLPLWQIEGIATFAESEWTSGGRLRAGDFGAITLEAARGGALEPIDRVNGGLTTWPDGHAPYAYGAGFHAYLARVYGAQTLDALGTRTAGAIPYLASRQFRRVFGKPLGALWSEYAADLQSAAATPDDPAVSRLTRHGHIVAGPRFLPRACPDCPVEVAYSLRTPHAFPSLNAAAVDGSQTRRLATRFLGSTAGVGRGVLVFDQQERHRVAGLYSDLHALDLATGQVRQLTRGQRLIDPDLSPDGATIAAVREGRGRRDLVTLGMDANGPVRTVLSDDETRYHAPRWSPDGRSIAVQRQRPGALAEIVLVDAASGAVRAIAGDPDTRFVTPAWRPDGHALVAAAAPAGEPFNLVELTVDGPAVARRTLTRTTGGATWPEVSPDGRTIVYVGYTTDGFDLFVTPYPLTAATPADVIAPTAPEPRDVPEPDTMPGGRYNPLATLWPTSWEPVVETDRWRAGATTQGGDVLGYHGWAATATWRLEAPPAGAGDAPPLDWDAVYVYNRWSPSFFLSASAETWFASIPRGGDLPPAAAAVRSRDVEAGVLIPFRRVRVQHQALASVIRSSDRYETFEGPFAATRTAVRGAWRTSSAQRFGFSIGPELGVTAGATVEVVPEASGAAAATADVRAYLPGAGRQHVVALRAAGAAASGVPVVRGFRLGGPAASGSAADFDRDALGLLRGFATGAFAGRRLAAANAEYRWPIARVERGLGTWPAFLHTLHASVFADLGHAWSARFRAGDLKSALGAELSADLVAGYSLRFSVTAGAAWARDGAARSGDRDRAAAFVRVGGAF